jgi:hypothetical protein
MNNRILVFYDSRRSDRMGIRLADYVVAGLCGRGEDAELIDARAIWIAPIVPSLLKMGARLS